MRGERVRDRLRAAARERPAGHVREHGERQADGSGQGAGQRQHRVRREPDEHPARPLAAERRPREPRRRQHAARPEPREHERMPRRVQRREDLLHQLGRMPAERLDQPAVALAVLAEPGRGGGERALEHDRVRAVERVRERRVGLDPLHAVPLQRQRLQERRRDAERMDRRADVVPEARQCELLGAQAAADLLRALEHEHADTGPREHDRGSEPVRPGADDDCIGRHERKLAIREAGPV